MNKITFNNRFENKKEALKGRASRLATDCIKVKTKV